LSQRRERYHVGHIALGDQARSSINCACIAAREILSIQR
jgi:hypothetical protein